MKDHVKMWIYNWKTAFFSMLYMRYISGSVLLDVDQQEIELGKPLKLSCKISGVSSGNRQWTGGNTTDVLCYNGVSFYPVKYYETRINDREYRLSIENVTENDLNCPYSCRFGFQAAGKIITVNEKNFKYLPPKEYIQVEYTQVDRNYLLSVKFEKVFPVPSCEAITKYERKNLTVVDKKSNGLFYTVQFSDQSSQPFHSCDDQVHIECLIKSDKYVLSRPHKLKCSDVTVTSNEGGGSLKLWFYLAVAIAAFVLVTTSVVIVTRWKKSKQLRENMKAEDPESQQSLA